ncbi:MAG: riboflavin synthase [Drouetiella hepatica Uher 2000/2452]|jgi:riboflavin synthase|uniref:Riboflavin synthase n=1 Tax=Drouetiella hepatica Uher 2000/2452 TaxID=904376 RepID=A0A951QBP4_9CYAN|nr:riboflavin synthase [Drouetiella hepatica Uher 2000/2452]
MFTGLIQAVGTVRAQGENLLQVSCDAIAHLGTLELGDSVAVDGICLTVTGLLPMGFTADVSPETLSRTTLGQDSQDVPVNLEPSLQVGSKLGGHFVTGHIDGVGYLESSVQTENAWEMSFRVPDARVARYIVSKGSIAINGVSLTIADCDPIGSWFKVAVIPLTYAETNLRYLQPGGRVNLEGDVLGKYVEKFLRLGSDAHQLSVSGLEEILVAGGSRGDRADVTETFLAEHGYS